MTYYEDKAMARTRGKIMKESETPTIAIRNGVEVVMTFEEHDAAEEMFSWLVDNIETLSSFENVTIMSLHVAIRSIARGMTDPTNGYECQGKALAIERLANSIQILLEVAGRLV